MKNKLLGMLSIMFVSASIAFNAFSDENEKLSSTMMANIDALASSGESSVTNTGPGKVVDCTYGGTGKYCLCENKYPCTETAC